MGLESQLWAHPASYSMDTEGFSSVGQSDQGMRLTTHLNLDIKTVLGYISTPLMALWHVQGHLHHGNLTVQSVNSLAWQQKIPDLNSKQHRNFVSCPTKHTV
jgi:hypothetical protein